MKHFLVIASVIFLSSFTYTLDCRNFTFGVSPEIVKGNESASFVKEEKLAHNLRGLTFIENMEDAIYMHTYTFHEGKLNGLRTKKISLTGDATYLNALNDYEQYHQKYSNTCAERVKEGKAASGGLKNFSVEYSNKRIYIQMMNESGNFFLYENTVKK